MSNRLRKLGIVVAVIGVAFLFGGGYAYMQVQDGYTALQSFSEAQNVTLSYNEDGQLVDRGTTEDADAIMSLLEDDWNFPVKMGKGGLDPNDPVVNNQSEYMYQMATIVYHTLHGEQTVVLTQDDIDAAIASERLGADGTYDGVVEAYQGQVLTPGEYIVPVNERYWTGFDRMDILDGQARELAWSGTAHALVAELGVGAATHSALMLALGIAGLLAGLGVVCTVSGVMILISQRKKYQVPDTVPQEFVDQDKKLETV